MRGVAYHAAPAKLQLAKAPRHQDTEGNPQPVAGQTAAVTPARRPPLSADPESPVLILTLGPVRPLGGVRADRPLRPVGRCCTGNAEVPDTSDRIEDQAGDRLVYGSAHKFALSPAAYGSTSTYNTHTGISTSN